MILASAMTPRCSFATCDLDATTSLGARPVCSDHHELATARLFELISSIEES